MSDCFVCTSPQVTRGRNDGVAYALNALAKNASEMLRLIEAGQANEYKVNSQPSEGLVKRVQIGRGVMASLFKQENYGAESYLFSISQRGET